jgi:hypothetical protein
VRERGDSECGDVCHSGARIARHGEAVWPITDAASTISAGSDGETRDYPAVWDNGWSAPAPSW